MVSGITVPHAKAFATVLDNMQQKQRRIEDDGTAPWLFHVGGWAGKATQIAVLCRAGGETAHDPEGSGSCLNCTSAGLNLISRHSLSSWQDARKHRMAVRFTCSNASDLKKHEGFCGTFDIAEAQEPSVN